VAGGADLTACVIMGVSSEVGGETQPKGNNNMSNPMCECGHEESAHMYYRGNHPCFGWEATTIDGERVPVPANFCGDVRLTRCSCERAWHPYNKREATA